MGAGLEMDAGLESMREEACVSKIASKEQRLWGEVRRLWSRASFLGEALRDFRMDMVRVVGMDVEMDEA